MLTELEYNWVFMVQFYATFAPLGVPSLGKIKVPLKLTYIPIYIYIYIYLFINNIYLTFYNIPIDLEAINIIYIYNILKSTCRYTHPGHVTCNPSPILFSAEALAFAGSLLHPCFEIWSVPSKDHQESNQGRCVEDIVA